MRETAAGRAEAAVLEHTSALTSPLCSLFLVCLFGFFLEALIFISVDHFLGRLTVTCQSLMCS